MTKIDISNPQALIPGLRKTQLNLDGTATTIEGKGSRQDFAMEVYDPSSFSVGGELPVVKDKSDKGIWAFISDWSETFSKHKGIKYIIPGNRKYAEYESVKSVVESVGYDGARALAKAYWTMPQWANHDKTIARFAQHSVSIYESIRRKRG